MIGTARDQWGLRCCVLRFGDKSRYVGYNVSSCLWTTIQFFSASNCNSPCAMLRSSPARRKTLCQNPQSLPFPALDCPYSLQAGNRAVVFRRSETPLCSGGMASRFGLDRCLDFIMVFEQQIQQRVQSSRTQHPQQTQMINFDLPSDIDDYVYRIG